MDLMLAALAVAIIALILLYQYLIWHYNTWTRLGLPGPKPKILLGSFPSVITGKQLLIYDMDDVYSVYRKSHRAIGVFLTMEPQVMILDPKLAHEIMVTNFGKFRDNMASRYVVNKKDKFASRNPFLMPGEGWKTTRGDTLGGLTPNKLNLAYPIWKESAQKLKEFLKEKSSATGRVILESKDLAYRFSANVMGDLLWGIDAGTFTHSSEPNMIVNMSQRMLTQTMHAVDVFYKATLLPILQYIFENRFFPAETDEFFSKLTQDAIAMRLKDGKMGRADFLNYVLQLQEKKNLSHDDVVGHMLTVMLDGFETTANAIFHTLFYLAKYETVQEKLRGEILANLQPDGYISFDTLNSLPYLEQCINETIRIISPIPVYSRICTESTYLEVEPDRRIHIKAGIVMSIPVFCYHHDPEYFPEPYKYRPERFDNAAHVQLTKQGIFMPFGDGPRICLGMRTGLLMVKSFMVQVLQEYRISCCSQSPEEKKPDMNSFLFGYAGDIWLQYDRL